MVSKTDKKKKYNWKAYDKLHTCELCGTRYRAKKKTSRYCTISHRVRAWQLKEGYVARKAIQGCSGSTEDEKIAHIFQWYGDTHRCVDCGLLVINPYNEVILLR